MKSPFVKPQMRYRATIIMITIPGNLLYKDLKNNVKTAIFIIQITIAPHSLACNLNESEILGSYSYIDGSNFFEEFSIETDGIFLSWLHNRPASNGRWILNGCTLVIEIGMPEPVRLKIIQLTPTEALIQTNGIADYAKYKRI